MTNVLTTVTNWFRTENAAIAAAFKKVGADIDKGRVVAEADLPKLVAVSQKLAADVPAFIAEVQALEPLLAQMKIELPAWLLPVAQDTVPVLASAAAAGAAMTGATAAPNAATVGVAIAAMVNAGNTVSVLTQQVSALVAQAKAVPPVTGAAAAAAVAPAAPAK